MPIWLRNFTFNKMKEHYENEASAAKKAQSGDSKSTSVIGEDGRVKSPEFLTKSKNTFLLYYEGIKEMMPSNIYNKIP